jgi:hypothetical protein
VPGQLGPCLGCPTCKHQRLVAGILGSPAYTTAGRHISHSSLQLLSCRLVHLGVSIIWGEARCDECCINLQPILHTGWQCLAPTLTCTSPLATCTSETHQDVAAGHALAVVIHTGVLAVLTVAGTGAIGQRQQPRLSSACCCKRQAALAGIAVSMAYTAAWGHHAVTCSK